MKNYVDNFKFLFFIEKQFSKLNNNFYSKKYHKKIVNLDINFHYCVLMQHFCNFHWISIIHAVWRHALSKVIRVGEFYDFFKNFQAMVNKNVKISSIWRFFVREIKKILTLRYFGHRQVQWKKIWSEKHH